MLIFTVCLRLETEGQTVQAGLGDPQGAVQRAEVYVRAARDQLSEVNKSNIVNIKTNHWLVEW